MAFPLTRNESLNSKGIEKFVDDLIAPSWTNTPGKGKVGSVYVGELLEVVWELFPAFNEGGVVAGMHEIKDTEIISAKRRFLIVLAKVGSNIRVIPYVVTIGLFDRIF